MLSVNQTLAELTSEFEEVRERLSRRESRYNWLPLVREVLDWEPQYIAESLLDIYFSFSDLLFRQSDKDGDMPVELEEKMFTLRSLYLAFRDMTPKDEDPCCFSIDLDIIQKPTSNETDIRK